jgi:hypothetical protein
MENNKLSSKFQTLAVVSGIYLVLIIILFIGDVAEIKEMKPNEWGDFLAGTFAPLAFLWLVFGYRQQGEELKQNTKAIKLQADELKNSVEQQKALVDATKVELNLIQLRDNRIEELEKIRAQPFFHFFNVSISPLNDLDNNVMMLLKCEIKNSRSTCREINISVKSKYSSLVSFYSMDLLEQASHNNQDIEFVVINGFEFEDEDKFDLDFEIKYCDENDNYQFQNIQLIVFKQYSETGEEIHFEFFRKESSFISKPKNV